MNEQHQQKGSSLVHTHLAYQNFSNEMSTIGPFSYNSKQQRSMNGERCKKCGQLPEDILMLTCQHDLCLKCAADRLRYDARRKQQLPVQSNMMQTILCEFCCTKTEIDDQTFFELEKFAPAKRGLNPSLRANSKQSSRQNSLPKRSEIFGSGALQQRKSLASLHNIPIRSLAKESFESSAANSRRINTHQAENIAPAICVSKKQCTNHPDEQLMYYCFDCNCECICPECVIHGEHKNHEVQTIKKSLPMIRSHFTTYNQSIQKSIDELLHREGEVIKLIDQAKNKADRTKLEIQKAFNGLVEGIHQKQREIMKKYDQALEALVSGYRLNQETLLEKVKERKAAISQISATIARDEITMLNTYAANHSTFERLGRLQTIDEGHLKPIRNPPTSETIIKDIHQLKEAFSKLDIMEQSRQVIPSISGFSYRSSLTHQQQQPSRSQLYRYLPPCDSERDPPDVACE